jgi:hypothetical protein
MALSFFDFLSPISGKIKAYNLQKWWIDEFNKEERALMVKVYQPLGSRKDSLIKGNYDDDAFNTLKFLSNLADWMNRKDTEFLAKKVIAKAEEFRLEKSKTLDVHFFLQSKIRIYYLDRANPFSYVTAISACKEQIELSPLAAKAFKREYGSSKLPSHVGFKQLAVIREKEKNYHEVIQLCKKALEIGWSGDWERRIQRCQSREKY